MCALVEGYIRKVKKKNCRKTSSDIRVRKFKSQNDQLEGIKCRCAQLVSVQEWAEMGNLPSKD